MVAARFWLVAAYREWWLRLSAPTLEGCELWFVARERRRARMRSPEMWDLCFVIVAGDSLICRCSRKMGRRRRVGMKRCCEWRRSKKRKRRGETARLRRPTSRRMGRSYRFVAEAGDKRKRRFYS